MNRLLMMVLLVAAGTAAYATEPAYAPQVSNVNGVKVTATLLDTAPAARTWNVELTIETHTRPLNEVLDKAAVLMADSKPLPAVAWQGAPPGGHHRKGVLVFNAVNPRPAALELRITMHGEAQPRSFTWRLK